jgi:hypothetical protein
MKDYNRKEVVEAFLKICDTLANERSLLLIDIDRMSKLGSFESAVALKDKDRVKHIEKMLISNKDMIKRFINDSDYGNHHIRSFLHSCIPLNKFITDSDFLEVINAYSSLSVLKADIEKLQNKYS